MSLSLTADTTMQDVLSHYPGAKRALFSHFHIGGCQSCAYGEDETLTSVCERNELNLKDLIDAILDSHTHDQTFLIQPATLHARIKDPNDHILLLDTRTREEHEAVSIPGSELLTQDLQTALFGTPPTKDIVFYDHTGDKVLDTCSWFAGHGIKNCYALHGGIDAYSREIDKTLPLYKLEIE